MIAEFLPAAIAVAAVAALYSSVGHGGASGYLAIMALLSLEPEVMKPGALLLNLLVAGIATVNYIHAGHFRFSLLWPFILTSIPLSYLGARMAVSPQTYSLALGVTLIFASARLAMTGQASPESTPKGIPPMPMALGIGAAVGFLSGMVGVGGGIFLSPLFILMNWTDTKKTGAVSAAFIWLNSLAGIAGHLHNTIRLPEHLFVWIAAAAAGGLVGSHFGAKKLPGSTLRKLLAVVLLVAAGKTILNALK